MTDLLLGCIGQTSPGAGIHRRATVGVVGSARDPDRGGPLWATCIRPRHAGPTSPSRAMTSVRRWTGTPASRRCRCSTGDPTTMARRPGSVTPISPTTRSSSSWSARRDTPARSPRWRRSPTSGSRFRRAPTSTASPVRRRRRAACSGNRSTTIRPVGYVCALADPDGNLVEISHDQGVYAKAREVWGEPDRVRPTLLCGEADTGAVHRRGRGSGRPLTRQVCAVQRGWNRRAARLMQRGTPCPEAPRCGTSPRPRLAGQSDGAPGRAARPGGLRRDPVDPAGRWLGARLLQLGGVLAHAVDRHHAAR